jgi:hypothetical protein
LHGTAAATHSNTTVNITDAVNLAGVDTTGFAALWVSTSSGRQWARITAISGSSGAWVVTVDSAYAVTASGQTWGIGGKRATWQGSAQLFQDFGGGWTIDAQTDDTLTATIILNPSNQSTGNPSLVTSTADPRPQISTSTNNVHGFGLKQGNNLTLANLTFFSTAGTPGNGINAQNAHTDGPFTITNCRFSGWQIGIQGNDGGPNYRIEQLYLEATEVDNCLGRGIDLIDTVKMVFCNVHDNASEGLFFSSSNNDTVVLVSCNFDHNGNGGSGASGVLCGSGVKQAVITHCNFLNSGHGSTGDGITFTTGGNNYSVTWTNNVCYGNKAYGVAMGTLPVALANRCNAYGGNNGGGSGLDRSNLPAGAGDQALTGNPFVSSSNWAYNNTAGAGALCQATGLSYGEIHMSNTATPYDLGAVQSGSSAPVAGFVARGAIMPERIPQSVAIRVPLQAYLATDHTTPATGKTIAVQISKDGAAYANPHAGATNATEIGHGSYYVDLDGTDTGTVGPLLVRGTEGTIDDSLAWYDVYAAVHARLTKDTALANWPFPMTLSDHITPATAATVSGFVSIDGAAEVALTNSGTIANAGNGSYTVNLAAADTNGDTLIFRFTASGCDDTRVYVVTQL